MRISQQINNLKAILENDGRRTKNSKIAILIAAEQYIREAVVVEAAEMARVVVVVAAMVAAAAAIMVAMAAEAATRDMARPLRGGRR